MEYHGLLNDEELDDFLRFQEVSSNPTKIDYYVTSNYKDQNDFLKNGILKIYNQVLFLRMFKVKILLKYEDGFFIDKRWERVIDLFNAFRNSTAAIKLGDYQSFIKHDTMYSFVRGFNPKRMVDTSKAFDKEEARDLFLMIKEENYELFKSFYEAHFVKLIGGRFINDTARN